MNKVTYILVQLILILLLLIGCNSSSNYVSNSEIEANSSKIEVPEDKVESINGTDQSSSNNVASIISVPIPKGITETSNIILPKLEDVDLINWQKAYIEFLLNYVEDSEYSPSSFLLNDFDNDGIAELIIEIRDIPYIGIILEIYLYDEYKNKVYYIGKHHDSKTGVSLPQVSNSTEFRGLFNVRWGGRIYYHGYINIENNELKYEELWIMDNTENPTIKKYFLIMENPLIFMRSIEKKMILLDLIT